MKWDDLPVQNVVDFTVYYGRYKHTVSGMDYYWMNGSSYGTFNATGLLAEQQEARRRENGHEQVVYEGLQAVAWMWDEKGNHIFLGEFRPENVHVLTGVMLDDDVARKIGLI